MFNSSEYAIFGMHSDAERYCWAFYHLFVLLSSFIGDTLILVASFQKEGIKVNNSILTIIQHIAISDLVNSLFRVLPVTISLIANSWVLGVALCYVEGYINYLVYPPGMYLIAFLTSFKLFLLRNPRRAATWSTKNVHQLCILIWIFPIIIPILLFALDKTDVHFDYRIYTCDYGYKADAWKRLLPIITLTYTFVPNTIIVATTIPTLMYLADAKKSARRVQGSVPWQGALTVVLTATVYCISTLPMSVYYTGKSFFKDPAGPFQFHLYRVSYFMSMINIMSNFFIYTLTIPSFRRILLSKVWPGSTRSVLTLRTREEGQLITPIAQKRLSHVPE